MHIGIIEEYFLWFMIYSIIGWLYESLVCSVSQRKFVNRGFLNGPYCPIYGFGAVIDIVILGKIENPVLLFVLGAIADCSLEYVTSYIMEKLFNARWWDYSDRRFNINGRICLLGAVVFGLFSVLLIKVLHPFVLHYTQMISPMALHIICAVLLAAFVTDCLITIKGFTGFSKKLSELSVLIEEKKADMKKSADFRKSEAVERLHKLTEKNTRNSTYEAFIKKLNGQQRRMIKAFPRLRANKHNDILKELRSFLRKIKKEK